MARKKAYDREEVLEKAMHTFWQHGYERTSVRLLEKDMGINQFSIYDSFGSKEELFTEVLKKYRNHVSATFLKELTESNGHLEDIRQFLTGFGMAVQEANEVNGCLMVNTSLEVIEGDGQVMREVKLYFEFIRFTIQQTLEKVKDRGEVGADFDIEKHSHFLLGTLQGLAVYAKFHEPEQISSFVTQAMAVLSK